MQNRYLPQKIESKWQKKWQKHGIHTASNSSKKEKFFMLIEFPYPSGERLHVGHARSYCAFDAYSRYKRMKGFNVMYPIGWDAFGLPAENYAIRTGVHPSITTKKNIETSKKQAISWGMSFDWDREIDTTSPGYYKWTQWIFLQLFKQGLAFQDEIPVNWCPSCKTNLANEEVVNGNCERCNHLTERRVQKQWLLKITDYADKLLTGLDTVDYRNDIKAQQVNWIGRKEGVNITYPVKDSDQSITCFTTRADTNYGTTFIVLAPENSIVSNITTSEYKKNVEEYISKTQKKSELERISETKGKSGVFTGAYAVNRLNDESLPIYVGDFVLNSVGTGAVVGVPAHDVRDFQFAVKFDLPVKRVVSESGENFDIDSEDKVFEGYGTSINSELIDGLKSKKALEKISDYLEEKGWGEKSISYHLRDWVFSRQHYWGEPIPIVHCEKCGLVAVDDKDLPVELPHVEKYEPTDTGESPLATMKDWVNTKCPKCGGEAKRETDTMPNWAGSSWYFLRYIDPKNDKAFADMNLLEKWLPVDWYNGGLEHTTLHLLYSRFWHKFLYDQGLVPTPEPYAKRTSHGVILGPDGQKMSKSRGNVVNPDDVIESYGADTLRMYIMFIGPFEQQASWNPDSLMGVRRFLNRVHTLTVEIKDAKREESSKEVLGLVHKLTAKVEYDLENMKFNTVVSSLMETLNDMYKKKEDVGLDSIKIFLKALAPSAPHLAEELWHEIGEDFSIHTSEWLKVEGEYLEESVSKVAVQVNGKLKGVVEIEGNKIDDKDFVHDFAISALNMREKHKIVDETRFIYVPGRVINFILK